MPNPFSNTGGTAHSTLVSGLVDGGSYSYYVRCQDGTGNANPDDFVITFSVESGVNSRFSGIEDPLSENGMWDTPGTWTSLKKNDGAYSADVFSAARLATPVVNADQYAEITYDQDPGSASWVGVMTRVQARTNGSGYLAIAYAGEVRLYRTDDTGTLNFPLLASASASVGTAPRRLRLESQGPNHRIYFNGALALSYTETTYTTGQPGIAASVFGGPTVKILSFVGGALTAPGASPPAVTFTGAPASAVFNTSFSVTASTNASTMPTITPTGVCTVGAVTGTPANATATVTMTSGTGTCALTANWATDATFLAATATQSTTATLATPTVSFTGAPAAAISGATFPVTATTNAGIAPTINGTAGVCTVTNQSGTSPATATITMISGTGDCTLTAVWAADPNYAAASATQTTVASLATPAVTLTGAPASAAYNASFTVTATTNASTMPTITPTGVCTVGAVTGTPAIATATVTMTGGTGTCGLTASWPGTTTFNAATATQSTAATKIASTTTINSHTPNPSVVGQLVTIKFTVSGAGLPAPSGNVTVSATTGESCSGTITAGVCTLTFITAGSRTLAALYNGDANYNTSTSAGVSQSVGAGVSITLTSSPNPSYVNQEVTFLVVVSGSPTTPTGSITFKQGTKILGTATLANGTASFPYTFTAAGNFSIVASYSGDQYYRTKDSTPVKQTVNKDTTSTVLTSVPNPSTYGQAVTLTATVSSAGPVPTGTVAFKNGGVTFASTSLIGGVAKITKSNLASGTLPITATYNGNAVFVLSTSPTLTQVVNQATTTTTVTASPNPSVVGQSVTFKATVKSPTVAAVGTVTFTDGTTTLGTVSLAGGKASLSTSALPSGTNTVTATYNGTSNIMGSSGSVLQTVK
jgi:hypothetical protein